MQSTNNEAADRILSELDALAPTIAARAAEAEEARRIPADILQMLKSVGLFRMTAPHIYGGLELDVPTVARILQRLFKIDGSIGWICRVASATPCCCHSCRARPTRKPIEMVLIAFAQGEDSPAGTAVAEAGGLRVNGKWPFASGCEDADWIGVICVLTQDGKPVPGPTGNSRDARRVPARWQLADRGYLACPWTAGHRKPPHRAQRCFRAVRKCLRHGLRSTLSPGTTLQRFLQCRLRRRCTGRLRRNG